MPEKNKNCVRCQKQLGFRKHDPESSNWGFGDGKLCNNCFEYVKDGIKYFDADYILGYSRFPFRLEGKLYIQMFDERNRVIFEPKKKSQYEIDILPQRLVDCNIRNKRGRFIGEANAHSEYDENQRKKIYQTRFSRR